MRTILWFIYFWIHLLFISFDLHKGNKLLKAGKEKELYALLDRITKRWAVNLLFLAGVTLDVRGAENIPDSPVVFVGNHQGNFDIPLSFIALKRPVGFIAKVEILKMPMIRTWMKLLKCIFIDRNDVRQSLNALSDSSEILHAGRSLLIFPEGTRSKGEEIGEFKAGAFKMAFGAEVPIVPFSIDGSYKIMERQGIWIKPGTIKVTILPPIETKGMPRDRQRALGDEIKEMILNTRTNY